MNILNVQILTEMVKLFNKIEKQWRIQGGAHPLRPTLGPNSFIFMQFSAENCKIIGWRLLGNPGSATE